MTTPERPPTHIQLRLLAAAVALAAGVTAVLIAVLFLNGALA
jgi:hypothetical protein